MVKYLISIILLFIFMSSCLSPAKHTQPNILFIMADDHATQAVGAYEGRFDTMNLTPNIDALAQEGMLFTQAFCTNAICTPSRASILTGQYAQTNGVLDLDDSLDCNKQYLPLELQKLGYTTAVIGKWHLKNEPKNFDYYSVLPGQGKYFDPTFREKNNVQWPNNTVKSKGHSSDIITNSTIDYLAHRDKDKPFFLMHHYKAPHGQFHYAPRYSEYLENKTMPLPTNFVVDKAFGSVGTRGYNDSLRHIIGSSVSARHYKSNYRTKYAANIADDDKACALAYQTYIKDYLRCVKGIDDNLGRLFNYLKTEGLWENTIIIYTSDQGFMLGAHDYIDKRWMYEESMQIPLIIHYPKAIECGTKSDLLVNNTDFAPTLLELAGGEVPTYMQGHSFLKTLKGKAQKEWRKGTYYRYWMHMIHHYVPAHYGLRSKDYKLIYYNSEQHLRPEQMQKRKWYKRYRQVLELDYPKAWEFYDLKTDPHEMVNKYDDPKYQDIIITMKKELELQQAQIREASGTP